MRLIHGEALEVLPTLGLDPARTAIVSDPPYGMKNNNDYRRFSQGPNGHGAASSRTYPPTIGDDQPFDPAPWLAFPKVILWGANHFARLLPVGTTLVWVKRHDHAFGSFLSDGEVGWQKGGHGVYLHTDLSMNAVANSRAHPNQKPVGLMRWCIQRLSLPTNWTIIDPYAGSGTTGIAAMELGYDFVGIECDPTYFATAQRRIADAQGPLFARLAGKGT